MKTKNTMQLKVLINNRAKATVVSSQLIMLQSASWLPVGNRPLLETVLAEKLETILFRNAATARTHGFYDVYELWWVKRELIDSVASGAALVVTCEKHNSLGAIGWRTSHRGHAHRPGAQPNMRKIRGGALMHLINNLW